MKKMIRLILEVNLIEKCPPSEGHWMGHFATRQHIQVDIEGLPELSYEAMQDVAFQAKMEYAKQVRIKKNLKSKKSPQEAQ